MKPYTNAVLSKEQGYFNYQQRWVQMVVEEAYDQLKRGGCLCKNVNHIRRLPVM